MTGYIVMRHVFNMRDPGGPPFGMGAMSPRDCWRYEQSLSRYKDRHGKPSELIAGEIGQIRGFRIVKLKG